MSCRPAQPTVERGLYFNEKSLTKLNTLPGRQLGAQRGNEETTGGPRECRVLANEL